MVFALETIVENFGGEMAPFAVGLCQHLARAFWRLQVSLDRPTLSCHTLILRQYHVGMLIVQPAWQACCMEGLTVELPP